MRRLMSRSGSAGQGHHRRRGRPLRRVGVAHGSARRAAGIHRAICHRAICHAAVCMARHPARKANRQAGGVRNWGRHPGRAPGGGQRPHSGQKTSEKPRQNPGQNQGQQTCQNIKKPHVGLPPSCLHPCACVSPKPDSTTTAHKNISGTFPGSQGASRLGGGVYGRRSVFLKTARLRASAPPWSPRSGGGRRCRSPWRRFPAAAGG